MECNSSRRALVPIAAKYNIEIQDPDEEGEKLIYFCPMEERWSEIRVNTFFLIYKSYINACRLRKELPNQESLDRYVKNETIKIATPNPSNTYLVENMLPFWTGHEITREETLEIL